MPQDLVFGDVYLPPLLVAAVLSMAASSLTLGAMRRHGIIEYFANPPLVFIALTVIYTAVLGSTLIPT